MFKHLGILLAQKNLELRNAVELVRMQNEASFYKDLEKVGEILEEWAGNKMFRNAAKPIKAILDSDAKDYGSRVGIGIFLEGEKYNDMRGWLLEILEAAEMVRVENESMKSQEIGRALREAWMVQAVVESWPHGKAKRQAAYEALRKNINWPSVRGHLDDQATTMGLRVVAERDIDDP